MTDTPAASGLRVALTADGRAGAGAADESPRAIGRHTHRRHRRWEPGHEARYRRFVTHIAHSAGPGPDEKDCDGT